MSANKRISKVLALLIPTGVLGISSALAATQIKPEITLLDAGLSPTPVAQRLADIRKAVSAIDLTDESNDGPRLMLAEWLNVGGGVGWRNGGWGNGGGWRNGGWGNGGGGWHNGGWGNGGWHNWGNGWHNWGNGGWHNFWHNW